MCWLKSDRWKAGITIAGMVLFLVFMIWVPVPAAGAYERASGLATPVAGTVQATPPEDATVTALNKEKLRQEVKQLQEQNDAQVIASNKEKLQHGNDWWWNYGATILSSLLSTFVVVLGALIGFGQWSTNRTDTQNKERDARKDAQDKNLKAQAEERFKTAVTALGDEKEGVQVGGAILLRSFLNKDDKVIYGRYYTQIFDLAVAYLRLPRTSNPPEDQDGIPHSPEYPNAPLPLTPLSQALITVFKESFPLVRNELKKELEKTNAQFYPQQLDATGVRLDHAYLADADLAEAWLVGASLREANLSYAQLQGADFNDAQLQGADLFAAQLQGARLIKAHLEGANLWSAHLEEAHLEGAQLQGARLMEAQLQGARLMEAQLQGASLVHAHLEKAHLMKAQLQGAHLSYAHLEGADLSEAQLQGAHLTKANPEAAAWLKDTKMSGVVDLPLEQREMCIKKGAIFDDVQQARASDTSSSSSLPPSQSNDAQAPSAPPAQVSTPTPDTDGISAPSSKPSNGAQAQSAPSVQGSIPPI